MPIDDLETTGEVRLDAPLGVRVELRLGGGEQLWRSPSGPLRATYDALDGYSAQRRRRIPAAIVREFEAFDRNRTGVLEPRELSRLLDALGFRADSAGVRDALRKYDANYDGRIDIGEFYDIFRAVMRAEPIRDDVCDVFAQYDRNRNGYLEVRELRNALAALGFEADRAAGTTTCDILRHFDADANGRLDLYEFNELVWELQRAVDRAARPTHYRGLSPGGGRADSLARSPGYYEWRY